MNAKVKTMLALLLCANSLTYGQTLKDSVTIKGIVSDYDGNTIRNCSVMFQNSMTYDWSFGGGMLLPTEIQR